MNIAPTICSVLALSQLELAVIGAIKAPAEAPHLLAITILTLIVLAGATVLTFVFYSRPQVEEELANQVARQTSAQLPRLQSQVKFRGSRFRLLPAYIVTTAISSAAGMAYVILLGHASYLEALSSLPILAAVASAAAIFVLGALFSGYAESSLLDRVAGYSPWVILEGFFLLVIGLSLPSFDIVAQALLIVYLLASVLSSVSVPVPFCSWILTGTSVRLVILENVTKRAEWSVDYLQSRAGRVQRLLSRVKSVLTVIAG